MNAIHKAVWHIEAHLSEPFSLENTARAAGVSKFHLSRSFGFVMGMSPSAYARTRRLSAAARRLAAGETDILSLALDTGYGSHEAFTRAFRDQFGATPEQVRTAATIDTLTLVEPRHMTTPNPIKLQEPEIARRGPILVASLAKHFQFSERAAIPALWAEFGQRIAKLPVSGPGVTYGVVGAPPPGEEGFEYAPSVEIRSIDDLPEGLKAMRIEARPYAIFRHGGHIAEIGAVCNAIYSDWSGRPGLEPSEGPINMIEFYPAAFNPMNGTGGFEIWLPLNQGA